jgi:hypothetical protein
MGTVNDQKRRVTDARQDDEPTRLTVTSARDWIYKRAYGIKSAMVERVLSVTSMVPTLVRIYDSEVTRTHITCSECILPSEHIRAEHLHDACG